MAIWKSENSMLTQRGIEILNKVKAGIGKITIAYIQAGSGRVSESRLYNLSSLSGTVKEMTLINRVIRPEGSEISFQIDNAGFQSEFNLNQIGIFVNHPDYVGAQLYHISQCDEDSGDLIPIFTDTAVSYKYSVFLEHANSSDITLNISPDLVGSTPRNLFHNWYLRHPVDTKAGRIVLRGIPYYSDTTLKNKVGDTLKVYQALKINETYSSFYNGAVTYYVKTSDLKNGYVASGGICINRWNMTGGSVNPNGCMYYDSNEATIVLGFSQSFYQDIAQVIPAHHFSNRSYVFSADIKSFSGGTPVLYADFGTGELMTFPITQTGILAFNINVPESATKFEVGFKNTHNNNDSTIKVSAVKLEACYVSTLDRDPPPDFAEQMAICVQYSTQYDWYIGFADFTVATASIEE